MRDWGGAPGVQHLLLLAESLGLAMARRAADILEQYRHEQTRAVPSGGIPDAGHLAQDAVLFTPGAAHLADDAAHLADDADLLADDADLLGADARLAADPQFAVDDAIFTAVLDAAIDCLGRFDTASAEDRWGDALVHLLLLARLAPDAG